MTTARDDSMPARVLPQVGAVLHLNSAIPEPQPELGSPEWRLDGSCALVSWHHVLTIDHAISKPGVKGVFLPGYGIAYAQKDDEEGARNRPGDYMALAKLSEEDRVSPIPHGIPSLGTKRIRGYEKSGTYVTVSGFGLWWRGDTSVPDGLQRQETVTTGQPRFEHYDNLDLNWWSPWNDGRAFGVNTSGGPVLWNCGDGWCVVGVVRERKGDLQIASWIGSDRHEWLRKRILRARPPSARRVIDSRETMVGRHSAFVRKVDFDPIVQGRWTVSADTRTDLQARIFTNRPTQQELTDLSQVPDHRGRFLTRLVEDGATTVWLAVTLSNRASDVGPVRIQSVLSTLD